MGRTVRTFGWLGAAALALVLVLGAAVFFLLQSRAGHDFILRTALGLVPRYVNGEVQVDGIRSGGLLHGFTLSGVAVRDVEGRPLLEADSVRVRYSWRDLLARELILVPAEFWRPRVTIETLHGDDRSNVERIFLPDAPEEPDPDATGPGFTVAFRQAEIRDGSLVFRLPVEEESDSDTGADLLRVEGVGGLYQEVRLSGIEARIREAEVLSPDREGERIAFESLSLTGQVLRDPFRLEEFRGVVTREGTRLDIDAERLRLPASSMSGAMALDWGGENALHLEVGVAVETLALADLRWVDQRIPEEGGGSFRLEGVGPLDGGSWRVSDLDFQLGGSRILGRAGVDLGEVLRIVDAEVELAPLLLVDLEPWLDEPLPVEGALRGEVVLDGPLSALETRGSLRFDDPARDIPESTATFAGVLHLEEVPGVTNLTLTLDPLDYGTLRAFLPEPELVGRGRVQLEASGRMSTGVIFTAEVEHGLADEEPSRVLFAGEVVQEGEDVRVAIEGTLDPFSMDGVAGAFGIEPPASGLLRGPVRADGLLSDLSVSGALETPAGFVELAARVDVGDPTARYFLEGSLEGFRVHELFGDVPEPTVLSGRFEVEGAGAELETLEGRAVLHLDRSEVAGVTLEWLDVRLRAEDGRFRVDELEAAASGLSLTASGDLALREGQPPGLLTVRWEAESLAALRPLFFGEEEAIASDTLSAFEREVLAFQGVDLDTLDTGARAPLDGRVEGEVELRGGLGNLTGSGFVEVEGLHYAQVTLERLRSDAEGRWDGGDDWEVRGEVILEDVFADRFHFASGQGEAAYRPGSGRFDLRLHGENEDAYRVAGEVTHDSLGVEVGLTTLELEVEGVPWGLEERAWVRVLGSSAVQVEDFRIRRLADLDDPEEVRLEARGLLDFKGDSDFQIELHAIELDLLSRIAQAEDAPSGTLDLQLDVRGPFDAPRMEGGLRIRDFSMNGTSLSVVEGTLEYAERRIRLDLMGERDGDVLLTLDGTIPIDLSFQEVENRLLDEPMDVTLALDSLPASTALAFLDVLEEVGGAFDGAIHLLGTTRDFQPRGEIQLRDGRMRLVELGLTITDVHANLILREDGTLEVEGRSRAGGEARVSGTVGLSDLANPEFDLAVAGSGFQAVDRRDMNVRVGADVRLTGSFNDPLVQGRVTVEQGEIFLEEFARTAEVVDVTDPSFFDVVDTTLVSVRPAVQAAQNPFMQNLRVDVDLSIQRDFWLRSREINAEIGGDLLVNFDRPRREIVLVGNLEAIRGSYSAFGRNFQVEGGLVEFTGTPGINPALNIEAVTRLRREGGEPLNVRAHVEGTLLSPRVRLSTDAQPPIAESDLISYLIFGRPSYALASGEQSVLQGAAGAGVSIGIGTLASQLGSVVAQQFGVDYLMITQGQEGGGVGTAAGLTGSFADTQIELGQYIGENLFLALVLRPLTGLAAGSRNRIPGARVEWRFTDAWSMEGFVEDRFARQGTTGFGDLGMRSSSVLGFSLFREWGY